MGDIATADAEGVTCKECLRLLYEKTRNHRSLTNTTKNQYLKKEITRMQSTQMTPEMEALKGKLRTTWMAGDFGEIAKSIEHGAVEFVSRLNLKPGTKVLDVATGTGNLAIPAAKTGADVTGIDIASNLIDQANERAKAEGVDAKFEVGDCEAMPYEDNTFDVVMTMFGAMFAPRPDVTASELIRVCKPGGVIAMANWTPAAFTGQMFKTGAKHVPPPPNMPSPVLWGTEDAVRERLGSGVTDLKMKPTGITFTYPFGPEEVVEHFRKYFGPTQKAFDSLDEAGQTALRKDLVDLWRSANKATDGTTEVDSVYLEVIATKKS
jgi:2-polyprenyl-3-methyl-5-hydroxy-6-metoxy-1,4-benzoquinol methylase